MPATYPATYPAAGAGHDLQALVKLSSACPHPLLFSFSNAKQRFQAYLGWGLQIPKPSQPFSEAVK